MAKLIVEAGENKGQIYGLEETVIIGRAETNPVYINDPLSSREHSKITKEQDGFYVMDLGSRNGTLVNGEKITVRKLKRLDLITIGRTHFRFDDSDAPASPAGEKPVEGSPRMKTAIEEKVPSATPTKPITQPEAKKIFKDIRAMEKSSPEEEAATEEPSMFSRIMFFLFLIVFFVVLLLLSKWVGDLLITRWAKSQPKPPVTDSTNPESK